MRVILERSHLLKSLNHVHRVVERRNTIPILSNVLLAADGSSLTTALAALAPVEGVTAIGTQVHLPGREGEQR